MKLTQEDEQYILNSAYKTFSTEHDAYRINASMYGERVMCYAEWLERYKRVCPEDIRMLVAYRKKQRSK